MFDFKMKKRITGSCYNISIYRNANDIELLSVMLKDNDCPLCPTCWKFNLGEWKTFFSSHNEIVQLMNQQITIETDECARADGRYNFGVYIKPQGKSQ